MAHPTISGACPHCGRSPGFRAALAAIIQTLRTMAFDQLLTGWRWLAFTHAIAGLLLVQHGASASRVARTIPAVNHDRLTRMLGQADIAQLLMRGLRTLAVALGPAAWIIDDVIVPKPAARSLAWAKGLWCPSERRYVHAINIVVLLACWGRLRIPLGFRLWCPKECCPKGTYRTKLLLARDLVAEALADGLNCQYVTFDSWYTSRPLTAYLDVQGLHWYGALAANHEVVWHEQKMRVDALGQQLHDWRARRLGKLVAGADIYSPRLGHVRLTRVRVDQPKRPYLYLVTNEHSCKPSRAWERKVARWPIEPMFRDEKQLLSLAGCHSPRVEAQQTHIALVMVAWVVVQRLRQAPSETTGEVREQLLATVWGHTTRFSAPVSDLMSTRADMNSS
jgi:DDE superfamily endonuclease